MSIEINNETSYEVDETALHRMAAYALDFLRVHPDAELNILLYGVGPMEELHLRWLDEPGPTDVLSFPMDQLRPGTEDFVTPAGLLGDVVLCPEVAEAQAQTAGHPLQDELNMLLTHGMLHLLGFDHAEPAEEKEMFGIQRDILVGFALAERTRES
jgi:probable rRNA maturation factor